MTETVYALLGYERYYPRADNTIRVFTDEWTAEKWRVLLDAAAHDAHFPVTYAELEQEFDWVPDRTYGDYSVAEYDVHESGYGE